MRVLMITWEYPPYVVGGMGKHAAELVPALASLAAMGVVVQVDVLTTRYGGGAAVEQVSDQVTVYRVKTPPLNPADLYNSVMACNLPLQRMARQLQLTASYDLIHIHDWLPARVGIELKHSWRTPLLVTMHATERGRYQGHLPSELNHQINRQEWLACFESWRIIVCSGFMANELQSYFGVPVDKISIIPNGIDPTPLQQCNPETVARLRRQYAPNEERLLFFIGRMTHEKGLQVLLQAMPAIRAALPDVRLLVAGKNSETLQDEVRVLGLNGSVELLGYISDEQRNALYAAVDAAIFPSLYEPFGIVALEAMAAGCNVIASDVGGLGEVVQHMHNGLTVLANDPPSIAWGVQQLFAHPERAAAQRCEARRQVLTLYNWSQIAYRTVQVYYSVVAQRRTTEW